VYHSSKTVKRQSQQQKSPLVYQSSHVYQECTNSVSIVKDSQKTVKQQKNDHWCTNRHMSTQSPPNTQSRANAATLRNFHHTCPSPVDRADCMCLHGRPCVWLLFAAACCHTLFYVLMMPAARVKIGGGLWGLELHWKTDNPHCKRQGKSLGVRFRPPWA